MESELYMMRVARRFDKADETRIIKGILMKIGDLKTGNLKASGILFILSGLTWFLAAALGKQPALVGVGVAFLGVGGSFIIRAKKTQTS